MLSAAIIEEVKDGSSKGLVTVIFWAAQLSTSNLVLYMGGEAERIRR